MELTITPEIADVIQRKVESGQFETPQQALENAVHRLEQDDLDFGMSVGELQAMIDEGWEEAERGETISGDEARVQLAELRALRQRG